MTKIEKEEFLDRVKNGKKGEIYELDMDDLLEILGDLVNDEDEEDDTPDFDSLIEECRQSALKAKAEIVKQHGEQKAKDVIRFASVETKISACFDMNIPIKQEWVDEYNELCAKIYSDICESPLLPFAYISIDHTMDDGEKSLNE